MFNRYQAVFRSRWRALWWSACVLLTAYCSVPAPEDDQDAGASLAKLVAQPAETPAPRHVNPWAVDKQRPAGPGSTREPSGKRDGSG